MDIGDALSIVLQALGVITAILAIGVAVAAGIGYFKNTAQKDTIAQLKDLVEALNRKVVLLENDNSTLTTRLDTLEYENSILRTLVTGEGRVKELAIVIGDNHKEVMDSIEKLSDNIATLVAKN